MPTGQQHRKYEHPIAELVRAAFAGNPTSTQAEVYELIRHHGIQVDHYVRQNVAMILTRLKREGAISRAPDYRRTCPKFVSNICEINE